MFQVSLNLPETPVVTVHTTENRGFTPEEVAVRCADKIVAVAETAPPVIRDQAVAYKKAVEIVIAQYMREAIRSDRTTVYNALKDAGHPELADAIRRL
jgi:HD superfamily phosphohydrolase YqeK